MPRICVWKRCLWSRFNNLNAIPVTSRTRLSRLTNPCICDFIGERSPCIVGFEYERDLYHFSAWPMVTEDESLLVLQNVLPHTTQNVLNQGIHHVLQSKDESLLRESLATNACQTAT